MADLIGTILGIGLIILGIIFLIGLWRFFVTGYDETN